MATLTAYKEPRRLDALYRYGVLDTPREGAFDRIAELARSFFRTPIALVCFVDEDRQWFKAHPGADMHQTGLERSFCVHTIESSDVLVVPDTRVDPRFRDNPLVAGPSGIRFYAGAPLATSDAFHLGALCVLDTEPRDGLTADEQATLMRLAATVIDELELRYSNKRLEDSEARYRKLFQDSPIGIYRTTPDGRILLANPALLSMLGANSVEELAGLDLETEAYAEGFSRAEFKARLETEGELSGFEVTWRKADGTPVHVSENARAIRDEGGEVLYYEGTVEDITARRRTEQKLRESESRYRSFFENSMDAVLITVPGKILAANHAAIAMFGYSEAEVKQLPEAAFADTSDPQVRAALEEKRLTGKFKGELTLKRKDGTRFLAEISSSVFGDANGEERSSMIIRDITERKTAERRAQQANEALRASEASFRSLIQNSSDVVRLFDRDGTVLYESPTVTRVLGYEPDQKTGKNTFDRVHPDDQAWVKAAFRRGIEAGRAEATYRVQHANGEWRWIESVGVNLFDDPNVGAWVVNSRDVTERKLAEAAFRDEKNFSEALLDSLPGIFYLFDESGAYIRWNKGLERELGYSKEDLAGLTPLQIVAEEEREFVAAKIREALEQGETYAPLTCLTKHGERIPYLCTGVKVTMQGQTYLAGIGLNLTEQQAARARIETLNRELERSNKELRTAYDTTIEGWARALDLKDEETEGHSRRVTELTVQLARSMGIPEDELVHVHRGALLHDIGKMGVPDSILLKPGKLTNEEWEAMKRHTTHAYELLSPISFLRPALDIPYCHHEKWNGRGYPRGLKGEQIPLAARIFAVVDVFDALTSDRPYRKAWATEQAMAFIKEQSGKHFDPEVVRVFLEWMTSSEPAVLMT